MDRRRITILGLLLVFLSSCEGTETDEVKIKARPVRIQAVEASDAIRSVTAVGTLEGENEVQIFSQLAERIVSLSVKEGDEVKANQVLAVLSADLQSAAFHQANAALTAAEANRDALKAEVEQLRKLVLISGATKNQLTTMENQLRATEAQVRQIATGLGTASAQKKRAYVRAPISGHVANLSVKVGDTATPQFPVMTIIQGKRVKAVFHISEREFLTIKKDMAVTITPLGEKDVRVKAKVSLAGNFVDRRTRTGKIEVELSNDDGVLVPGSAVRARIELERRPGVIFVPADSVLLTPDTERTGEAIAFVAKGNKASRRELKIGSRQGDRVEVISGLKVKEHLIVRGQHLLRDASAIDIVNPPPALQTAKK